MRLLCVGRHPYLSEHLCRFFGKVDAQCEPVVGTSAALSRATQFEPHVVIVESDLLSPAVLDEWSRDGTLNEVPVIAVSLTHRPDECESSHLSGLAGVIYLPVLDRDAAVALLKAACRPRGVAAPAESMVPQWRSPAIQH